MIYNISTVDFDTWYKELTSVAISEYDIELAQIYQENFKKRYLAGMDIYEAIQTFLDK